jgi:NADP-dependent 3-hydroxy acid dehydrogenase YdfG
MHSKAVFCGIKSGPQTSFSITSKGQRSGFADTNSIVTGGASGIGETLATAIACCGGRVVIADRQLEQARRVAQAINNITGDKRAVARELDVRNRDTFAALLNAEQPVDYLFNNAGIVIGGDARAYSSEDWHNIIDVNLHGVINGVQAALPVMEQQGYGHIINTASLAGLVPSPHMSAYATTKHAVVGLSTSLRAELAATGIRISVLCPGAVHTAMRSGGKYGRVTPEVDLDQLEKNWKKLRPITPPEFAERALNGVLNNRSIIIQPRWWRLLWWFYRVAPGPYIALITLAARHNSGA